MPRRNEPVTVGIPFASGAVHDAAALTLLDAAGGEVPLQTRILDRWLDGSVRWLLADFQATVLNAEPVQYRLAHSDHSPQPSAPTPTLACTTNGDTIVVDTGAASFTVACGSRFPFSDVRVSGVTAIDPDRSRLSIETVDAEATITVVAVEVAERGPLRCAVRVDCRAAIGSADALLDVSATLHFFAASSTVRFELTLRNPRRAEHAGGCWPLGDRGSVLLRDVSLVITTAGAMNRPVIRCSIDAASAPLEYGGTLEVYQDSSGGANWNSRNHVNREGRIPTAFRGYRVRHGNQEQFGLRATPLVSIASEGYHFSATMPYFWEQCPKAIEALPSGLTLRLFPRQFRDAHELQGGEQKTHSFVIAFGLDRVTDVPLAWARAPLQARMDPEWYARSEAVKYLAPLQQSTYASLVNAAIDGPDSFECKRDIIDEYGWRHFGDIYADHEAVFHHGPDPLISHYNNQYDGIAGMAIQFFRSGDCRWLRLMRELASHVIDIDVYHTDGDKAAYNRGLFWHTYHYRDADLATHRSYPRLPGIAGGGPSAEHNYSSGLMLHHFLTGDEQSRQTVIDLARWVINMDDGAKTVFRWLDRGPTGLATNTGSPDYHSAGRGAAYSINSLLDAHRLTSEPVFLEKAEALIRRCIHPADDIAALDLLNPEPRWSYVIFLQELGKYLDYKAQLGAYDAMFTHARASLLAYARWMATHERPYLDKPEILEYPTETWVAHDIRKAEVLTAAALYSGSAERRRFLERAAFFFDYATSTLATMPTRTLARPLVILLQNGHLHEFVRGRPSVEEPSDDNGISPFPPRGRFRTQKMRVQRRLVAAAVAMLIVAAVLIARVLR